MRTVRFLSVMAIMLMGIWNVVQAQTGLVKLDRVSATVPGDNRLLMSNQIHQAYIRYDLRGCAPGYWWAVNGFEIYSPDGANWGYLKGTDGPLVTGLREGVDHYASHWYLVVNSNWSKTGNNGEDSVACGLPVVRGGYHLSIYGHLYGLIGGVDNDVALILEFTTSDADYGRTICLDTSRFLVSDSWQWGVSTSWERPVWNNGLGVSGPRCWEVFELPCSPEEPERARTRVAASETACEYCCTMRVGNVDGSEEETPSLGDIMAMVDAKFVSGNCDMIPCLNEANIDKSGGYFSTCDDITLGDIMLLVDYLFISGPENTVLPACY